MGVLLTDQKHNVTFFMDDISLRHHIDILLRISIDLNTAQYRKSTKQKNYSFLRGEKKEMIFRFDFGYGYKTYIKIQSYKICISAFSR